VANRSGTGPAVRSSGAKSSAAVPVLRTVSVRRRRVGGKGVVLVSTGTRPSSSSGGSSSKPGSPGNALTRTTVTSSGGSVARTTTSDSSVPGPTGFTVTSTVPSPSAGSCSVAGESSNFDGVVSVTSRASRRELRTVSVRVVG